MKPQPDMDSIVRSWLEHGANRLPDRVLDSVLDQLPAYPQHRPRWPMRRFPPLNTPVRIAIAAAAIVVVSFVAIRFLPGNGTGSGPTPIPTSPGAELTTADIDRPLEAGRYAVLTTFLQPFSITLPVQWTMASLLPGDVSFHRTSPPSGAPWVNIDIPEGVFADPCHTEAGPSPAPTTVDGVVAALTSMVDFEAGPVTDVTIGPYSGKAVTLVNTVDTDTAACTGGPMLPVYMILGGIEAATNGGATERLSVLDVRGTVVVINGETFPDTIPSTIEDIAPIVESLHFR